MINLVLPGNQGKVILIHRLIGMRVLNFMLGLLQKVHQMLKISVIFLKAYLVNIAVKGKQGQR